VPMENAETFQFHISQESVRGFASNTVVPVVRCFCFIVKIVFDWSYFSLLVVNFVETR
jgi:hypothetical protein